MTILSQLGTLNERIPQDNEQPHWIQEQQDRIQKRTIHPMHAGIRSPDTCKPIKNLQYTQINQQTSLQGLNGLTHFSKGTQRLIGLINNGKGQHGLNTWQHTAQWVHPANRDELRPGDLDPIKQLELDHDCRGKITTLLWYGTPQPHPLFWCPDVLVSRCPSGLVSQHQGVPVFQ